MSPTPGRVHTTKRVTIWGLAGAAYGLVLAVAVLMHPIGRPAVALAATLAYTLVAIGLGTLVGSFWVNLLVPGALLLIGYWLSGFFFRDPQPWLERWLLAVDRAVGAERWMSRLPRAAQEVLEFTYAADYVVIGGGAIYVASFGTDAVAHYWALVLASELASYAPLPWLRSRPPRALEASLAAHPFFRRLNTAILDNASVQANTLPSGHVSGAVAAAFGIVAVNVTAGWAVMIVAGVIAIAAIAGRYHYVVDCVAGAAVAAAVWSVM